MTQLAEILRRRSPVVNILSPDRPAAEAIGMMADRRVGAVLLVSSGNLVGIFSERDVLRRVLAKGVQPEQMPLHSVMTRDPITATPDDERMSAVLKMREIGCRHLPIVNEGAVIDMISIRDLLFGEIADRDAEIAQLRRYIQGT